MTAPAENSLWGHKWGFADTYFEIGTDRAVTMHGDRYALSGYAMPHLVPYIESLFDIQLDPDERLPEREAIDIPAVTSHPAFYDAIAAAFPSDLYSFADRDRLLHSHGQTTFEEVYKVLYRQLDRVVDMVFFCTSTEDAERIIELAIAHDVCLVPFGGGTSVSCALTLPPEETRPIVSVDMKRMNRVEWIDTKNLRARVQAGITGAQLESALRERGYTCGHEPDSLELSTLGGWIATNASGMKKNRYGNIEDIVENITLVTPSGRLEQVAATSRVAMGMQLQPLLFGNEGNLGLVTEATIKIHPLPAKTQYNSLLFPHFDRGVECLYELAQSNYVPASIRLVDNHQFRFGQALKPAATGLKAIGDRLKKHYVLNLKKFDPTQMAAATVVMEGSESEVRYQNDRIATLAKKHGGLVTGAENGRRGYMLTYAIAYFRDFLASHHIIGETFETSAPWSQIQPICTAVQQVLDDKHQQFGLPGKPYLSYRISQIYHSSVCIYFMFGFYTKGVRDPEVIGSKIEYDLRRAIIDNGGSISHHHGVGKIRRAFVPDTLSEASI
ncbi:MAG: FAD-binding oxidoreductase, partial [Cyanobacteria bacterium P01_F01_bin.33]